MILAFFFLYNLEVFVKLQVYDITSLNRLSEELATFRFPAIRRFQARALQFQQRTNLRSEWRIIMVTFRSILQIGLTNLLSHEISFWR